MALAIIGGTGLEATAGLLESKEDLSVETPFGSTGLVKGVLNGGNVIFLARHGLDHKTAPHQINYRANIWALKEAKVTHILAAAAVGSLKTEVAPSDLVVLDQFIDFTKNRESTFAGLGGAPMHVDMTDPYDGNLRRLLLAAAGDKGIDVRRTGTYVCVEGPRFETPAEINMFRMLGGDVIGMTGVPEVVLANELGIPYASLAVVTNYAAGLAGHGLTYRECAAEMEQRQATLMDIFLKAGKAGRLL